MNYTLCAQAVSRIPLFICRVFSTCASRINFTDAQHVRFDCCPFGTHAPQYVHPQNTHCLITVVLVAHRVGAKHIVLKTKHTRPFSKSRCIQRSAFRAFEKTTLICARSRQTVDEWSQLLLECGCLDCCWPHIADAAFLFSRRHTESCVVANRPKHVVTTHFMMACFSLYPITPPYTLTLVKPSIFFMFATLFLMYMVYMLQYGAHCYVWILIFRGCANFDRKYLKNHPFTLYYRPAPVSHPSPWKSRTHRL